NALGQEFSVSIGRSQFVKRLKHERILKTRRLPPVNNEMTLGIDCNRIGTDVAPFVEVAAIGNRSLSYLRACLVIECLQLDFIKSRPAPLIFILLPPYDKYFSGFHHITYYSAGVSKAALLRIQGSTQAPEAYRTPFAEMA